MSLWLPYTTTGDLAAAERFYTGELGLTRTDGWDTAGERGIVLRVPGHTYLELVSPGPAGPAPLAFELPDAAAVDAAFARWGSAGAPPARHPRGHYGFALVGPAGVPLQIWSET